MDGNTVTVTVAEVRIRPCHHRMRGGRVNFFHGKFGRALSFAPEVLRGFPFHGGIKLANVKFPKLHILR